MVDSITTEPPITTERNRGARLMTSDKPYVLGHSTHEIRRLELQSNFLLPPTLRLLREVGLREGMSVLDIGTGAGDVAILAAGIVGPTGSVLGIDRNEAVLERARARAQADGLAHVRFAPDDLLDAGALGTFDLVIGRFVLIFQLDKPDFLRKAASLVKPGGMLAHLETMANEQDRYSSPPVSIYDWTLRKLVKGFEVGRAEIDVGSRLAALFHAAGLPEPDLFCEQPVGGPSALLPEWASATLESLAPALVEAGELQEMDFAAHVKSIREEALRTHSALFGPRTVGAWSRIG